MATPNQKAAIGATALQLTATPSTAKQGIEVQANPDNAAGSVVYVGFVGVLTTTGWPLAPGASKLITRFHLPAGVKKLDPSLVYVIGSTTGLKASFWTF